ncbi:MAG: transketolase [Candidatus Yanofskybacteria bacterium]|nr:transketolase [Candidatus Yanofskybacteria bacterium]
MINKKQVLHLEKKARELRRQIIKMIYKARASHIASAYSVLDIVLYLYSFILRIDPKNPKNQERDRFILSKGWAVSALYAVLADRGFFKMKELDSYCMDGSKFIGIATMSGVPGVETTTGSMGHGLPVGAGMAIAGKKLKSNRRVFVVISDGELDEGSTWEAILFAGHNHLDNLVVVVDYNGLQSFGRTKDVLNLDPLPEKFRAFGWMVTEAKGHDFISLEKAFAKLPLGKGKPTAIIAHTIKGKGVSFMENRNEWHYKYPSEADLAAALKELSN